MDDFVMPGSANAMCAVVTVECAAQAEIAQIVYRFAGGVE